jgi:hypothetical protein
VTPQERFGTALQVLNQHRGTEPYNAIVEMLRASVDSMKEKLLNVEIGEVPRIQGGAAQMNYLLGQIVTAAHLANEPQEG